MLQKRNIPAIDDLLRDEPERRFEMVRTAHGWRLDLGALPLPLAAWRQAHALGPVAALNEAVQALFAARIVNPSEARPALHMALRAADPRTICSDADAQCVLAARERLLQTAEAWYRGSTPVRHLLHIGIGGSDLGPRLVADALDPGDSAVQVHWLSTLDERRLTRLLSELAPEHTAVLVASKSFATRETLLQAGRVREWMGADASARLWAATARPDAATGFGVPPEHVLAFPDWTGGRFSLWSGVGLGAAARIGPARWQALLDGAAQADRAFRDAPANGLPAAFALAIDALVRGAGFGTLGVISYAPELRLLAAHLQQLLMESLGKSVDVDGRPVDAPTAPLVFGGVGTDMQHSLFQALHQGTARHPVLLVGAAEGADGATKWRREQLAHLLAQARVLVHGADDARPERKLPGGNPVMTLLARRIEPASLGALLADLEHAVYVVATRWRINAFDQWGVEEGKRLALRVRSALDEGAETGDPMLDATLAWLHTGR
ncbi:MAG: glucose-6-phosphate isomerase [Wenzhouxiangellaceae bacterium]